MRKNKALWVLRLLCIFVAAGCSASLQNSIRGVIMEEGKLMRVTLDGRTLPMKKEMMINGMKVMPNGEVAMAGGAGFILQGKDGMMADGMFGVLMRDGLMLKVYPGPQKNRMVPMTRDLTLLDGSIVMKDGKYLKADGRLLSLAEGEELEANGMVRKWGVAGGAKEDEEALKAEWGDIFRFVDRIDPIARVITVTDRKGWSNELAVTSRTRLTKNGETIRFSDIKIGDHVTYQYEGTVKDEWLGSITVLSSESNPP